MSRHHVKKALSFIGRVVVPPGAAVAAFWAVASNWAAIAAFIYQFVPDKWSQWYTDNVATLPAWVAALVAGLFVLSSAVYFRNWQLGERLAPKLRLEFDPNSSACMRDVQLGDGTPALYVRVLPVCETEAMVDNCKGHLSTVYHRQTETDKWKATALNERLTLTWANVKSAKCAVMPKLPQHLDVLVALPNGGFSVPVLNLPFSPYEIFAADDFYRLDIAMSGAETTQAWIHLQFHRTADWRKPSVRVLGPDELETA